MLPRAALLAGVALLAIVFPTVPQAAAAQRGLASTAALQVALRSAGLYSGDIDGFRGPQTTRAVRRFQQRHGLAVDGIAGPGTRAALGARGRRALGARRPRAGQRGWDVAELQFLMAWAGFPSGALDGVFGSHTEAALLRFQHWAHLAVDGVPGPATLRRLRRHPRRAPLKLARPTPAPAGDGFGPREATFHPGIDYRASYGTPARAARGGRVLSAGWDAGGYGNLVVLAHGHGMTTMYAHLSRISVSRGVHVAAGRTVGFVGATGYAFGPHLHFEVRIRGAAVDPATGYR